MQAEPAHLRVDGREERLREVHVDALSVGAARLLEVEKFGDVLAGIKAAIEFSRRDGSGLFRAAGRGASR